MGIVGFAPLSLKVTLEIVEAAAFGAPHKQIAINEPAGEARKALCVSHLC
jgi:hypothetical protein